MKIYECLTLYKLLLWVRVIAHVFFTAGSDIMLLSASCSSKVLQNEAPQMNTPAASPPPTEAELVLLSPSLRLFWTLKLLPAGSVSHLSRFRSDTFFCGSSCVKPLVPNVGGQLRAIPMQGPDETSVRTFVQSSHNVQEGHVYLFVPGVCWSVQQEAFSPWLSINCWVCQGFTLNKQSYFPF